VKRVELTPLPGEPVRPGSYTWVSKLNGFEVPAAFKLPSNVRGGVYGVKNAVPEKVTARGDIMPPVGGGESGIFPLVGLQGPPGGGINIVGGGIFLLS
jgi:hypothetical protein